ncbi:hypothetical protein [Erwinia oleae]|uniref:hypothetical protein n=1 Tax=Erwinia oleae TaxID=796334 RepID=UPI0012698F01|nr:hypothetical protein [Erwinia oleae]
MSPKSAQRPSGQQMQCLALGLQPAEAEAEAEAEAVATDENPAIKVRAINKFFIIFGLLT